MPELSDFFSPASLFAAEYWDELIRLREQKTLTRLSEVPGFDDTVEGPLRAAFALPIIGSRSVKPLAPIAWEIIKETVAFDFRKREIESRVRQQHAFANGRDFERWLDQHYGRQVVFGMDTASADQTSYAVCEVQDGQIKILETGIMEGHRKRAIDEARAGQRKAAESSMDAKIETSPESGTAAGTTAAPGDWGQLLEDARALGVTGITTGAGFLSFDGHIWITQSPAPVVTAQTGPMVETKPETRLYTSLADRLMGGAPIAEPSQPPLLSTIENELSRIGSDLIGVVQVVHDVLARLAPRQIEDLDSQERSREELDGGEEAPRDGTIDLIEIDVATIKDMTGLLREYAVILSRIG